MEHERDYNDLDDLDNLYDLDNLDNHHGIDVGHLLQLEELEELEDQLEEQQNPNRPNRPNNIHNERLFTRMANNSENKNPPRLTRLCVETLTDEQITEVYINRKRFHMIYCLLVEHEFWKNFFFTPTD